MTEIMQLAESLGKAIAQSPQAANLRAARAEMEAQKDLLAVLQQYQQQADRVGQLEEQQKPVEVEDKRKLQELHDKLVSSPVFKKYTSAQVEYIDVMRKVNAAIRRQLAQVDGQ